MLASAAARLACSRCGKLVLVDLAGSERLCNTGNTGDAALRETGAINRSLFTLGQVGGRGRAPRLLTEWHFCCDWPARPSWRASAVSAGSHDTTTMHKERGGRARDSLRALHAIAGAGSTEHPRRRWWHQPRALQGQQADAAAVERPEVCTRAIAAAAAGLHGLSQGGVQGARPQPVSQPAPACMPVPQPVSFELAVQPRVLPWQCAALLPQVGRPRADAGVPVPAEGSGGGEPEHAALCEHGAAHQVGAGCAAGPAGKSLGGDCCQQHSCHGVLAASGG